MMQTSVASLLPVLAVAFVPEGNGLRTALGGSLAGWLVLGGTVVLVLGYCFRAPSRLDQDTIPRSDR